MARGTIPVEAATKAMALITNDRGEAEVPITFVTNSLNTNQDKANQLSNWFKIPVGDRHNGGKVLFFAKVSFEYSNAQFVFNAKGVPNVAYLASIEGPK